MQKKNIWPLYSQEEVDFGGDGLTAGGGEVLFLDRSVGHAGPHFLHHVFVGAEAPQAEVKVGAALNVASAQRQERNKACDELLLNDVGVEEATWREREREQHFSFLHHERQLSQLSNLVAD